MKIAEMIFADRSECSGCEACANICPKNAIAMTRDVEGFAYPKINEKICIKCGKCDEICPALNFTRNIPEDFPKTFVAIHPDEKILQSSSSGGVFTALSEIILKSGGVIFGASFDKNFHVYHRAARNFDELENLRGSKYVQSQIGDVYRQVSEELKSRKVLFSGTPCQCVALKNFLGGDHENLLTVEIICHGVPSPALWENYIGELSRRNKINYVNFRSKRNGWTTSTIEISFLDRGYYIRPNMKNFYGKLFLNGLSERLSCRSCKFKFPNGQSDLTIGDAWGVHKFAPEMFDNRGTSIVFVHTAKGKNFFSQTNLQTQQVKFADTLANNMQVISSASADERRGNFFAELAQNTNKFAVMEKYYYQDDTEFIRKSRVRNQIAFRKNFQDILAQIRNQFKQNLFVVVTPLDRDTEKILIDFLERNFPNSGIYILSLTAERQFICLETFSSITFEFKEDAIDLSNFAKKFNITGILVENFVKWKSIAFINWLKNCGLPLQTFFRKTN